MKILVLLLLLISVISCDRAKLVVPPNETTKNTARIELLEAEQAILVSRVEVLENNYSELTEVHEYLLTLISELETSIENNTTDIITINEHITNIYNDIDIINEALDATNCIVELREHNAGSNRADIYIVCDEGEFKLRNNAKLD